MSSADLLVDLGNEGVEVHSGQEALERYHNGSKFDLMIADYSMPGHDGGRTCESKIEKTACYRGVSRPCPDGADVGGGRIGLDAPGGSPPFRFRMAKDRAFGTQ